MSKRAKCPSLGTSLPTCTHSYLSHSRFLACNCRPDADAKSKVVSVEIQRQVEMDMARTASKDNQNIKAQLADVGMGILLTVTSAILLPSWQRHKHIMETTSGILSSMSSAWALAGHTRRCCLATRLRSQKWRRGARSWSIWWHLDHRCWGADLVIEDMGRAGYPTGSTKGGPVGSPVNPWGKHFSGFRCV